MFKKITLLVIAAIILGTILIVLFNIFTQVGIDIKIKNETNKEISGLYITYEEIKSNVEIKSLKPGEKVKINIRDSKHSSDDFDEAALLLEYKDDNGKVHTEYLVGYMERSYWGFVNVKIKKFNENGRLNMDIKSFAF